MPKYEITLSDGRRFEVEADAPPSEQDVFSALGISQPEQTTAPTAAAPAPSKIQLDATEQLKRTDLPESVRHELEAIAQGTAAQGGNAVAADVAIGAGKGVVNTGLGLGQLFYKLPGIKQASDATQYVLNGNVVPADNVFNQTRDAYATPTNGAQKVGFYGEQVGEMFIPNGSVARAARTGEAATRLLMGSGKAARMASKVVPRAALDASVGGVHTLVQTQDPTQAGVAAGTSAVLPVLGAARRATADVLKTSAANNVSQAFNATGKRMKRVVEQATPEILKRRVYALSKSGLASKAEGELDALGSKYDEAADALPVGDRIAVADVRAPIQAEMQKLVKTGSLAPGVAGPAKAVPVNPEKYQALQKIDQTLADLGDRVSRDTLQAFKEEWATRVAQAGGYAEKAGDDLQAASMWAKREGAAAVRRVLAQDSPDIAALDAEYTFWTRVRDAAQATVTRERSQKGALARMGGMVGAAAGMLKAGPAGAAAGAAAMSQLNRVIDSPAWKLASAHAKNALADALMSGNTERINLAFGRIVSHGAGVLRAEPVAP